MKLGISGHRTFDDLSLVQKGHYLMKLIILFDRLKPTMVNIGGAKGFDCFVMAYCYKMKIPYTLYLPFKGFVSDDYKVGSILYKKLLDNAVESFYEAPRYTDTSIYMSRNRKIVDNSKTLLVYWNGKGSGTANTVRYASQKAMLIKNIF